MAMEPFYLDALNQILDSTYVPHLPSIPSSPDTTKQRSRALGAFGMAMICDLQPQIAASQVVDDYRDFGVDAFHWDFQGRTLFLVQSKHQPDKAIGLTDVTNFGNGIAKIVAKDFANLNSLFSGHLPIISSALDDCDTIQPVFVTSGIGLAWDAVDAYRRWHGTQDQRIASNPFVVDGVELVKAMLHAQGFGKVDARIPIKTSLGLSATDPTLVGRTSLLEWVKLLERHGIALFQQNIRLGLGSQGDVNQSILNTIETAPEEFFLLNNGITVIAEEVIQRHTNNGFTNYDLKGISVVNGAQTLTTAAVAKRMGLESQLARAYMTVTVVKVGTDEELCRKITKARNHQNAVRRPDFSSLDPIQETLRRRFALLGLPYIMKSMDGSSIPEGAIWLVDVSIVSNFLERDAMAARNAKRERALFETVGTNEYKIAFDNPKGSYLLYNTTILYYFIQEWFREQGDNAQPNSYERLCYWYSPHLATFIAFMKLRDQLNKLNGLLTWNQLSDSTILSTELDILRQQILNRYLSTQGEGGPFWFFGNSYWVVRTAEEVCIDNFGVTQPDPILEGHKNRQDGSREQRVRLFSYLASKAPQIEI